MNEDFSAERSVMRGGAITFLAIMMGQGLGLVIKPIITRYLSREDYGTLRLGLFTLDFVLIFALLGLRWGVARYVAFYRGRREREALQRTISSAVKVAALSGTLAGLLVLLANPLLAQGSPSLSLVLRCLAFTLPFSAVLTVILGIYIGHERMALPSFSDNVFQDTLILVGVIVVALAGLRLNGLIVVYAGAPILLCLLVILYTWRRGLPWLPDMVRRGPLLDKTLLRFSLPIVYIDVMRRNRAWLNPILVGYLGTAVQTGQYDVAYTLATLTGILNTSLRAIFQSVMTRLFGRNDRAAMVDLYQRTTRWTFCASIPLFLTLLLFPADVLGGFFGGMYRDAATTLQLLTLGFVVQSLPGANGGVLLAFGRSGFAGLGIMTSVVVNLIAILLLVPPFGVEGTALAFALSSLSMQLVVSMTLYSRHRVHPFTRVYVTYGLLSLAVVGGLGLLWGWLVPHHFLSAAAFLVVAVVIEAILLLRSGFTDERDRALLRDVVRQILRRHEEGGPAARPTVAPGFQAAARAPHDRPTAAEPVGRLRRLADEVLSGSEGGQGE